MRYSTKNCTTSFQLQLADFLRSKGFDVLWHESGVREAQTAGIAEALDTVTLVREFPSDKTLIVDGEATGPGEVSIPALSLHMLGGPKKLRRVGLGDSLFLRQRICVVDGFASDDDQWEHLSDLLHDWVCLGDVYLSVSDFDSDASDPPALAPVRIEWGEAERLPHPGETPPLQRYLKLGFAAQYHE